MTLKDESPSQKVSNMLLEKNREELLIAPERMKLLGQNGNDTQLWMYQVIKVKSNAAKNSVT